LLLTRNAERHGRIHTTPTYGNSENPNTTGYKEICRGLTAQQK